MNIDLEISAIEQELRKLTMEYYAIEDRVIEIVSKLLEAYDANKEEIEAWIKMRSEKLYRDLYRVVNEMRFSEDLSILLLSAGRFVEIYIDYLEDKAVRE